MTLLDMLGIMNCKCGNLLSDFHDAFMRGLCIECYLRTRNTEVRPVTNRDRIRIKHTIDLLRAYLLMLCCLLLAAGIVAIAVWSVHAG